MIRLFLIQVATLVLVMSLAWWWQRRCGNAGWVDVFWTFGTGIAGILGALWPFADNAVYGPRQFCVAVLAAIWAGRLGWHLQARVRTRPEDARYAGFRKEWGDAFQGRLFWLLMVQAAAAWPLAAAILLAARNPAMGVHLMDLLGLFLFVIAVLGESAADRQLARFSADPANRLRVCDKGLWAWSRHPNYFFEFLIWWAWPCFAFNSGWHFWWISLVAPVLMYWLLVHVSGIPPLEKVMLTSRGDAYRAYQRRTSRFFPLPPGHEDKR